MAGLSALLGRDGPVLADGAMATTLFGAGLAPGTPPEWWLLARPAAVAAVHAAFVAAGADILLTNSFGATPGRLRAWTGEDRCRLLNRTAARLARRAAAGAGKRVLVAGSLGPPAPEEPAAMARGYAVQAEALAAGGADLAWIETVGDLGGLRAAADGARRAGLPTVLTASFERAGRTRGGLTPAAFLRAALALDPPPLAVGANCGDGPAATLRLLPALRGQGLDLAVKPNAGVPRRRGAGFVHPATPAVMAGFARAAVASGAMVVGGCCGTSPAHLRAMARALHAGPEAEATPPRAVSPASHWPGG